MHERTILATSLCLWKHAMSFWKINYIIVTNDPDNDNSTNQD